LARQASGAGLHQQGRLADAGIAADQQAEPGTKAAAGDAVEFGRCRASAPGGREANSSTKVFQAPHASQRPDHLEWEAPQDWQT
jgi:hypothetical protein